MKAFEIRIEGIVQGVGFRYFTKRVAERYGIKGFVRNEEDGSVFIHAEGEEENLKKFLAEVSRGPSAAVVTDIHVKEVPPQNFRDFAIKR